MRRREMRAIWIGVLAAALLEFGCPVGAYAQAQRAAQMEQHGLAIGIAARDLVAAGFRVVTQDSDFIRNRQWMIVAVVAEPEAGAPISPPSQKEEPA